MTVTKDVDYKVIEIVRRNGGVCILVYIPSLDQDISVNFAERSFNEMIEYEITRQIEESVGRFLYKPPAMMISGENDKISRMRNMLVGDHKLGDVDKILSSAPQEREDTPLGLPTKKII